MVANSARLARLAAAGDYFGVHMHPIRWCPKHRAWIHDFEDAAWHARTVRGSLEAYAGWAGEPARHSSPTGSSRRWRRAGSRWISRWSPWGAGPGGGARAHEHRRLTHRGPVHGLPHRPAPALSTLPSRLPSPGGRERARPRHGAGEHAREPSSPPAVAAGAVSPRPGRAGARGPLSSRAMAQPAVLLGPRGGAAAIHVSAVSLAGRPHRSPRTA